MKKLLVILAVVAMVCSLGLTAFAAPVAVDGYTFTSLGDDLFANVPETATNVGEAGFWSLDVTQPLTVSDGKVTFSSAGWGSFGAFADNTVSAGKDGIAFYVANGDTENVATIAFGFNGADNAGYMLSADADVVLVDMEGNTTEIVTGFNNGFQQGAIDIPADFKGWVLVPFDIFVINDGSYSDTPFDYEQYGVASISFAVASATEITYGGDFYAYELAEDTPSDEPSDNPSDDNNDDEQESTADISVIAYAVAAISGLGALVVAKRK